MEEPTITATAAAAPPAIESTIDAAAAAVGEGEGEAPNRKSSSSASASNDKGLIVASEGQEAAEAAAAGTATAAKGASIRPWIVSIRSIDDRSCMTDRQSTQSRSIEGMTDQPVPFISIYIYTATIHATPAVAVSQQQAALEAALAFWQRVDLGGGARRAALEQQVS